MQTALKNKKSISIVSFEKKFRVNRFREAKNSLYAGFLIKKYFFIILVNKRDCSAEFIDILIVKTVLFFTVKRFVKNF